MKKTIIRTGLETAYFTGMHHWLRPLVGGVGAILTLHHVRPPRAEGFQPNRLLEVTPDFLEGLLRRLARARIDVVSLDEMHRQFIEDDFRRRFVCLTFDDGYKDFYVGLIRCCGNTDCHSRCTSRPAFQTGSVNCGGSR